MPPRASRTSQKAASAAAAAAAAAAEAEPVAPPAEDALPDHGNPGTGSSTSSSKQNEQPPNKDADTTGAGSSETAKPNEQPPDKDADTTGAGSSATAKKNSQPPDKDADTAGPGSSARLKKNDQRPPPPLPPDKGGDNSGTLLQGDGKKEKRTQKGKAAEGQNAAPTPAKRKGGDDSSLSGPSAKRAKSNDEDEAVVDAEDDVSYESEEQANPPVERLPQPTRGRGGRGTRMPRMPRGRRGAGPGRGVHVPHGGVAGIGRGAGRGSGSIDAMDIDVEPVIIPPPPEGEMTLEQKNERMATLMHLVSVIRARLGPALKSVGQRLGPNHMNQQLAEIQAEMVALMGFTPEELARSNEPKERGHRLPTSSPPPREDNDEDMVPFEDAAGDAGPAASSSTAPPPTLEPHLPSKKSKGIVRFADPVHDALPTKPRQKKVVKSAAVVEDSGGESDKQPAAGPSTTPGAKPPTTPGAKPSSRPPARARSSAKGKGKAEAEAEGTKLLPSDIDSSEAEEVERERNPRKPGRLSAEQVQEVEAKAQEIENWVTAKSEEWGKTPKTLYEMLGMLQKLGRAANLWNLYEERWAATEAWLENESPAAYVERCYKEFKRLTDPMSKEQRNTLRAELNAWREEYRSLCAQDVIDNGDRFKVQRKLIAQLQSITRCFWTHYQIAVFGFLVCTDGSDLAAQAAGGNFANTDFVKAFMNEKALAISKLKQDMILVIITRMKAAGLLNDHSVDGAKTILEGGHTMQTPGRDAVRMALKAMISSFYQTIGLPPLRKMKWTIKPLADNLLNEGYRIVDWPNATPRIDEAEEARFQKAAQDKVLLAGYQWLREDEAGEPHTGMCIEEIPPDIIELKESNPTEWRKTSLWTTVGGAKLLLVGWVMDNKIRPSGFAPTKTTRAEPKEEAVEELPLSGAEIADDTSDADAEDNTSTRPPLARRSGSTSAKRAREGSVPAPSRTGGSNTKNTSRSAKAPAAPKTPAAAKASAPRRQQPQAHSLPGQQDDDDNDDNDGFDSAFMRRQQIGGGDRTAPRADDDSEGRNILSALEFTHMGMRSSFARAEDVKVETDSTSSLAGALGWDAAPSTRGFAQGNASIANLATSTQRVPVAPPAPPRFNVSPAPDVLPAEHANTASPRSATPAGSAQTTHRAPVAPSAFPPSNISPPQDGPPTEHANADAGRYDTVPQQVTTPLDVPLQLQAPAHVQHGAAFQPSAPAQYQPVQSMQPQGGVYLPVNNLGPYGIMNGYGLMHDAGLGYGGGMMMGYPGGMGYGMPGTGAGIYYGYGTDMGGGVAPSGLSGFVPTAAPYNLSAMTPAPNSSWAGTGDVGEPESQSDARDGAMQQQGHQQQQ